MNEKWTQDLRQRLAQHEQPAPEMDWNTIFRAVDEQRMARRRKTVVLWRAMAAAAVLAGVLAGGAVYLSRTNDPSTEMAQARDGKGTDPKGMPAGTALTEDDVTRGQGDDTYYNNVENYLANGDTYYNIEENRNSSTAAAGASTLDRLVAAVGDFLTGAAAPASAPEEQSLVAEAQTMQPLETPSPADHPRSLVKRDPRQSASVGSSRSASSSRPTMGFGAVTGKAYVAGALGSSTNASAMNALMSSAPSHSVESDFNNWEDYPEWSTATAMDRQVKHHQPIRLGVSVRYQIDHRWSVEGGVSYSHHSSDITETSGSYERKTDQQLTFIGIPVNANYSLYSNRHVNIYASAGGEVERLVHGKATTKTTYNSQPNESGEEKVRMSRPVFSVRAAVGVEAKLGETFSVYAEPALGYHFDNGAQLETIYKDKPLNGSVNLGVRFTLK